MPSRGSRRQRGKPPTPVEIQILLSLVGGPRHGYGIKLDVEQRTTGAVSLGSGTLYQALQRLEAQAWISVEEPEDVEADARRGRSYRILKAGREALRLELELMRDTVTSAPANALVASGDSEA